MDIKKVQSIFADPPAEYRPMPLWVWNDELQWGRLKEQLTQFKKLGFGGVFVHPRPGLITEYLGEEWFDLWKKSMLYCKKLGMQCNIYDENSYPSGFAGGYVPSVAPETVCQYVAMNMYEPKEQVPGSVLAAFRVRRRNGRILSAKDVTHLDPSKRSNGEPLMAFQLRRAAASPWTGDFPYTDLTNPETVKAFIATTHERYYKLFGSEFGKTVKASFADEPLIGTTGAYDATQTAVPLSQYSISEFQRRYGYDLVRHLPSLFADVGDFRAVRFDYWQLIHDLWKENFMQPLGEWCKKHGILLTGHYMEHEWPAPFITPDDMSLYPCMQMPGIDLLLTTLLLHDRRFEGYSLVNDDTQMLFTMRMLLSVVNQLGIERTLAEMWGAGGWDSTVGDYKRIGDWALAHGINFFNPHLSLVTTRGARKRDHPQTFSDHSAWWSEIEGLNDRIGRLSFILSQGRMENRVLVLQPTTSGFLCATLTAEAQAEFERMRKEHGGLVQTLCDNQIDFDLGDEYILEEHGRIEKARLAVGREKYDLVIIPKGMTNMRHQTLTLLGKYLQSGGRVLALSSPAHWVDGRESDSVSRLKRQYPPRWREVRDVKTLVRVIKKHLEPVVSFSSPTPKNFSHHRRCLADGSSIHFFFNGSPKPINTKAMLRGKALQKWDPGSGEIKPGVFVRHGKEHVITPLRLNPTESVVLRVLPTEDQTHPLKKFPRQRTERSIRTDPMSVSPSSPNVLPLDYCDVSYFRKEEKGINTWRANWNIWQAHGFERPAWDNAVQFRKRIVERNSFGAGTGFDAAFRFTVSKGVDLTSLELAVECPELYRVFVNGRRADFTRAKRWIDPHLMSAPIGRLARPGVNEVRLVGRPFDVKMELENVYIRGNFSLEPTKSGFRIVPHRAPRLGAWSSQGYPLYGERMDYDTTVTIPRTKKRIIIKLPSWKGGSASVEVDGKRAGVIAWAPYELDLTEFLSPGRHALRITVSGTPKNLFGPFHDPARSRNTAWPHLWSRFPQHGPPKGTQYDTEDYGLFKPMRLLLRDNVD
ncbi:MAG: glycosyl hydrolase [Bacteroidota bacterium]